MDGFAYENCTVFTISECCGEKYVSYCGYFYSNPDDEEKPWRFVQYDRFGARLSHVLENGGIYEYELTNGENVKQRICDLTEIEAIKAYNELDWGIAPTEIADQDVTVETHCGMYVLFPFIDTRNKVNVEKRIFTKGSIVTCHNLKWEILSFYEMNKGTAYVLRNVNSPSTIAIVSECEVEA